RESAPRGSRRFAAGTSWHKGRPSSPCRLVPRRYGGGGVRRLRTSGSGSSRRRAPPRGREQGGRGDRLLPARPALAVRVVEGGARALAVARAGAGDDLRRVSRARGAPLFARR